MQNFKPIKNPQEHFATFWKQQNPDSEKRLAELEAALILATNHVNSVCALSQCATIEVLNSYFQSPTATIGAPLGDVPDSHDETPNVYWVVSGDIVEVALIACEMMKIQRENERIAAQDFKERMAQFEVEDESGD